MKKFTLFIILLFFQSSANAYQIDRAPVDPIVDRYSNSHTELYLNGEEICKTGGCFHFTEGEPENLLEKHSRMIFDGVDEFENEAVW